MSTAWYKPNRLPRKIRSWASTASSKNKRHSQRLRRSIEVWETTCVVTNMNSGGIDPDKDDETKIPFSVLINPGNPSLSGVSKFSYFPVGGPEPPPSFSINKDSHPIMGYVTSWGGMEVGKGMSFASNTVDGLVHQYGGNELKKACEAALSNTWTGASGKVDEGQAIHTPVVGSELKTASGYNILVHTVPPFVDQDYRSIMNDERISEIKGEMSTAIIHDHNDFLLAECYHNSLEKASSVSPDSSHLKIACPLLGAGCRGFSAERAIRIAASATTDWMAGTAAADTTDNTSAKTMTATNGAGGSNGEIGAAAGDATKSPFSMVTDWFRGIADPGEPLVQDIGLEYSGLHESVTLAFGIPDSEIRQQLIEAIDRRLEESAK